MNTEKLDDLASQAGFDVARLRAPHPGGFPREDMLALESFAELIVEECVNWIDGSPTTEEGTLILSKCFIIANIKQHFGVEE